MKRCLSVFLALLICGLTACGFAENTAETENTADAENTVEMSRLAGVYRYQGEGFGGDFTITLNADGTYTFYEGYLSSYIGTGTWNVNLNTVYMTEDEENGTGLKFMFGVEDDALIYVALESDAFPYVKVADGERFVWLDTEEKPDE